MAKRETMTLEQLEDWQRRIREQEREVSGRIKAKRESIRQEERRAEDNAKYVLGGMLLAHLGGDWKAVDFEAVRRYLDRYADALRAPGMRAEALPLDDARKRLRKWESNVRERAGKDPRGVTALSDGTAETGGRN